MLIDKKSISAACQAIMDAKANPNSLLRVTFQTIDQIGSFMEAILYVDEALHLLDTEAYWRQVEAEPDGLKKWPIIELKNGSGIELVLEPAIRKGGI